MGCSNTALPIEQHVFGRVRELFDLPTTVTLYDLTNTYLEGNAEQMPKAKFGGSKEKRSDCRLLTLAVVLDGSGFIRRSQVFDGNVVEGTTLEAMLEALDAPPGAMVIMDRGLAEQDNSGLAARAWISVSGGEPRAPAVL